MMYARKFGAALVMGTMLFAGCDKETKTTETKEVKTEGGTTKQTTEVKTEKSGENPPPATGTVGS
jgi:protein involved in sex pheromone biosynthesis